MTRIILLNKPYGVLSQFTSDSDAKTLKTLIAEPGFYPAGRLDKDSEGLMILTDDGNVQSQISDPKYKKQKVYAVQVEGHIETTQVERLKEGVVLKDGPAKAIEARIISQPMLWDRIPPIRERRNIPTTWIEITLNEGKNRQIRRMTAKIGHPTLRLVRISIANWSLGNLQPGEVNSLDYLNRPASKGLNVGIPTLHPLVLSIIALFLPKRRIGFKKIHNK